MAKTRKKKELPDKQKKTIKKMKETRQIDSSNLRQLIIAKKTWAINEVKRGQTQMQELRDTILKLQGILTFIEDLTIPIEKEEK